MTPTLLVALALAIAPETSTALNGPKQLFLDDELIASSRNLTRQIHPAQKHPGNPLLQPTERWESAVAIVYGSVIRDGEKYRMWYLTGGGVAYAESEDGIAWKKPGLGIVRQEGRDTNLVVGRNVPEGSPGAMPYFLESFGVFRDERDPDPARRYKMGFLSLQRNYSGPDPSPYHGRERRGLGVAVSPDGLHWRLQDNWATQATCDGPCHWMFDPQHRQFVLYGRTKYALPELTAAVADKPWLHFWGRSVIRATSPDFLQWQQKRPGSGELVLAPDTQDPVGSEIYSMMVFPYEGVYLGLVQMYHKQRDTCWLELQLATSRDTVHFTRVGDRTPFIPVGPEGSWDRFNNSIATGPPLVMGDTLGFYYGGRSYRHSPFTGPKYPYHGKDTGVARGAIGLATISRDRFVSMTAGAEEGELRTKPVRLGGQTLHLNAAAKGGQILVEVLDSQGKVLARSKPVREDALDIPVAWEEGGLNDPATPVTLRFRMTGAQLFAVWCR